MVNMFAVARLILYLRAVLIPVAPEGSFSDCWPRKCLTAPIYNMGMAVVFLCDIRLITCMVLIYVIRCCFFTERSL